MALPYYRAILLLASCPLLATAADVPDFADLLNAPAAEQADWGQRYEHGEGVAQDYDKAVRLYCAAARHEHALAQYQLGWMYANGRGVAQNDELAAAWFTQAAQQGDAYAQRMVERLGTTQAKARCILPDGGEDVAPVQVAQLLLPDSAVRRQVEAWVRALAPEYGLDPLLVLAVIAAESGFNNAAISPKNAQGLMQLIPDTAARFGVTDPFDPQQNLRGGMAYLRWLLAYFQGDVKLALAGYNAGEKAVDRYRGIPPYPETQAYVARITSIYPQTTHPPVKAVVAPSAVFAEVVFQVGG